jgi:hypothetical protein
MPGRKAQVRGRLADAAVQVRVGVAHDGDAAEGVTLIEGRELDQKQPPGERRAAA